MTETPTPNTPPQPPSSASTPRTAALAVAKGLLLAAVILYVARAIVDRAAEIDWEALTLKPVPLIACILALTVSRLSAVGTYRFLLTGFGHRVPFGALAGVTWIAPMGKYLPGKVAAFAGAILMLRKQGVPLPVATGAPLLHNGLSTAVAIGIAAPLTLTNAVADIVPHAPVLCGVLLVGAAVVLHPRVFCRLINLALKILQRDPIADRPHTLDYFLPLLTSAGDWLANGLALAALAAAITNLRAADIPTLIAVQALAMAVGFLAFFAPGGIGVREGILLLFLQPILGPGPAAVVVVAMRLVITLVEAVMALIAIPIVARYNAAANATVSKYPTEIRNLPSEPS